MSALPQEADIRQRIEHVCFVPIADTSSAGGATPAGSWWSALMTPGWAEYAAVVTASSTPVM